MITKEMIIRKIKAFEKEKPVGKKTVVKLAMSLLLAGLAAWWSIPYVFAVRGYYAIGGEYCLIIWMGALPWLLKGVKSMRKEVTGLHISGYDG